jgi:hypothetical protein
MSSSKKLSQKQLIIPHLNARPRLSQRLAGRYTDQLGRRNFLRGALGGLALQLALPKLELFSATAFAQSTDMSQPFFGVFYWANGTPWHAAHGSLQAQAGHPDLWTPSNEGAGYMPSELLSSLTRHQVSVITGLEPHTEIPNSPGGQGDGHMRGFMVALTGDRPQPETFDHSSHTLTSLRSSLDQYVARHPQFYQSTPMYRSLEVGISEARFHQYGHWNAISYNGPNSQNLPISTPSVLYDRLFNISIDTSESDRRSATLDAVLAEAQHLRAMLGQDDQMRLDAHLEHLNALQGRLDQTAGVCQPPSRPLDTGDLIEKTRVMGELIATAIRCNLTRCFSLQLTSPASTHIFSNLNVPDGMHKTCHDGHWERVREITRYQMEAFAAFLDAFQVPDETGAPLIQNGLIYGTSEYGEGWKHSVKELPVILAGQAGGRLRPQVHVRAPQGNLCVAQLSALRALGLPDQSFGWNGAETSDTFGALFV